MVRLLPCRMLGRDWQLRRSASSVHYLHRADNDPTRSCVNHGPRSRSIRVIRSLRRVNLQGSFFGQTVAIRFGLSESDVEALELLLDNGAATAGRLAELMGLTTGAVTRVIDRLEQAGYVRRVPDPADRRRVVVEPVPEKVAGVGDDAQFGERPRRSRWVATRRRPAGGRSTTS